MKTVYISHPFSGNPWKNRAEARDVCVRLKKEHPDWCIVNPLDAFQWLDFVKISYERALEMCIEILCRCDAIYMCRFWDNSKGCRAEYRAAKNKEMEVIYE